MALTHRFNVTRTVLLFAAVAAMSVCISTRADYPAMNGPTGNLVPKRYGHVLMTDLQDARLKWKSETQDLGYGKGSVSGYIANLVKWPGHPGSWSAPIVADGKVFVTSFRPSGKAWAQQHPAAKGDKAKRWFDLAGEKLRDNLRIDGDDLLVAIDQATGKTLWTAVEKGKGLNRYMGKREGFGPSAVYDDGRVFSIGTTGRLYAYDAKTGKRLWETHIGPAHERMEQKKKEAFEKQTFASDFGWDASPVVADGVLIVPMFDHAVDTSLRGVDPKTGKTLWEREAVSSRYATPAVWSHGGKQYVLVATRAGEMRLIQPSDGKVLWKVGGLGPTWYALTPSATHVMVNVDSKQPGSEGKPFSLLAAYKLSASGAERAWTMPDDKRFWFEGHMDSVARRRVFIRDGKVYHYGANKAGDQRNRTLNILDEKTGKVLLSTTEPNGDSFFIPVEDRLLHVVDGSHSDRLTIAMYTADPANFKRLSEPWKPPHQSTTGYEVFMEIPYVDGCIYMRTAAGDVRCYDLRKAGVN